MTYSSAKGSVGWRLKDYWIFAKNTASKDYISNGLMGIGELKEVKKDADFAAFENVLAEARGRVPLRILGYTVMGNHWHFVVWPKQGQHAQVSDFFRWLTVTHSQRWHAHHGTAGMGHVYQGRFKSSPI